MPRILQVEDHPINRILVEGLLRRRGVEVINAENGQQAVELLCTNAKRPDMVLMDLQMPVMDGIDATRLIRAHEAAVGSNRVPIIALTAGSNQRDRDICSAAGMDDFLVKPVKADDLYAKVQRWIPGWSP
jgi:CheY-like chemotaxis protein